MIADDIPRCGTTKVDGTPCRNRAGRGTSHPGYGVCQKHGGEALTNFRQNAAKKEIEARHHAMGLPVEINPHDALLEEVYRTAGHVRWLNQEIGKWRSKMDVGDIGDVSGLPTEIDAGELSTEYPLTESQKEWFALYIKERDHLAKVSKLAIDAGVATRAIQLAEAQADRMVWVIEAFIKQVGLTDSQRRLVPDIMPNLLREVASERMDRALPYGKEHNNAS